MILHVESKKSTFPLCWFNDVTLKHISNFATSSISFLFFFFFEIFFPRLIVIKRARNAHLFVVAVEAASRQARRVSATLPLPPCEARGTPEFEADGQKKRKNGRRGVISSCALQKKGIQQ